MTLNIICGFYYYLFHLFKIKESIFQIKKKEKSDVEKILFSKQLGGWWDRSCISNEGEGNERQWQDQILQGLAGQPVMWRLEVP